MNPTDQFSQEVASNIHGLREDTDVQALSRLWLREVTPHKYTYNFSWMGRPIIQLPQDMVAMQEILWNAKPDLIVETGIAHGGSLIFYASILELIGSGHILGVDIDIRPHNREAIVAHPMSKRITLVEGPSTAEATMGRVEEIAKGKERVLVVLDSNHTHDHVLDELRLYSKLVKKGGWLIVMDTLIEDMPDEFFTDRPWKRGNSPKSAVRAFLRENDRFESDFMVQYMAGKSFSIQAQAVLAAGKNLWRAYFAHADARSVREDLKLNRPDVGWYQVRKALEARNDSGDLSPVSFQAFQSAYKTLTEKLQPLVYDLGFLKA